MASERQGPGNGRGTASRVREPARTGARQARKGGDDNHAELDALYQELGPGLIRYLRRLLHYGGLAEDVAQDAFLILVRRWPDVRKHPCPKAWLYTVARHLAMATLRERSHEFLKEELPDREGPVSSDPEQSYSDAAAVREAIGKLSPRQREAVWLYYYEDFAQDKIATIMQIQRGAVGALLYQARSRLAGLLGWPDREGQDS
jgi:RNA polymerase sigma factor (sigma-70 family)